MSLKTHNVWLFVEMTLENTEKMDEIQLFYDSLINGCVVHCCVDTSIHSRLVSSVCVCVFVRVQTQVTNLGDLGVPIREALLFSTSLFSSTLL